MDTIIHKTIKDTFITDQPYRSDNSHTHARTHARTYTTHTDTHTHAHALTHTRTHTPHTHAKSFKTRKYKKKKADSFCCSWI